MKPSLGRIVLVKTLDKHQKECIIPAIIVKIWSDECINVVAFNDGLNDLDNTTTFTTNAPSFKNFCISWLTSIVIDTNENEPSLNHWIWPPRV